MIGLDTKSLERVKIHNEINSYVYFESKKIIDDRGVIW